MVRVFSFQIFPAPPYRFPLGASPRFGGREFFSTGHNLLDTAPLLLEPGLNLTRAAVRMTGFGALVHASA
ncbi:hypothetical protein ASF71_19085 [Deinococcus sp. Leaf326]|nr:hypothetical protein ASF71_19085 [Deinococcus sp. Leaf326]